MGIWGISKEIMKGGQEVGSLSLGLGVLALFCQNITFAKPLLHRGGRGLGHAGRGVCKGRHPDSLQGTIGRCWK